MSKLLSTARLQGESTAAESIASVHALAHRRLRRTIGLQQDPPPACEDRDLAYFPPDSVTRRLHRDLPSMLIGGLASLLFQTLHPRAMQGVAEHSRYRDDPLGRLERTAYFVGITTFGSKEDAARAIKAVSSLHRRVVGTTPDGEPYAASDPDLLTWVHCVEVACFLEAARRYGGEQFTSLEQDAYVQEMSRVAYDLGAQDVPRSVAQLESYLTDIRPELTLTPEAKQARNFVLRGVGRWPHELVTYGILVSAAQGVLPLWAQRQLKLVTVPASNALVVRPVASVFCRTLRLIATPPHMTSEDPPSTTTTSPVT